MLGRTGFVTEAIEAATGLELGRWIYGLTGIWIAQMLSFTPISFLVLVGVVEGISRRWKKPARPCVLAAGEPSAK